MTPLGAQITLDPTLIRGLVFDLDGTLIDSYRAIADSLNYARESYGLPPLSEETVRAHVGRGLEFLVADLVGEDCVEEGVRLFRLRYADVFTGLTEILPGVLETIQALASSGYRMSVASNKPARFTEPILEGLGLREYFRSVFGPDNAGSSKPDPGMIGMCLDSMEVTPEHAAYVGDMVLDVESGERAGLAVILVPGGSSPPDTLHDTGRTVIDSFSALLNLLKVS